MSDWILIRFQSLSLSLSLSIYTVYSPLFEIGNSFHHNVVIIVAWILECRLHRSEYLRNVLCASWNFSKALNPSTCYQIPTYTGLMTFIRLRKEVRTSLIAHKTLYIAYFKSFFNSRNSDQSVQFLRVRQFMRVRTKNIVNKLNKDWDQYCMQNTLYYIHAIKHSDSS